ncbi:glutamate transporter polyphemus-like isoform X2 [Drosophila obscura]|uniref:glutamate transporter polyphemus-like isoform X2 n=1 Tax=Drosophila obscura TaxID=7282 RepID=UPI001BB24DD7|nr:glutamate transporter polyphemus-like isoform X2 [Drosophila obscura]
MTDNKDYNPYDNRVVEVPITNTGAFVSLLKCVIGTGILALPLAFAYTGWMCGSILLILTTIMLIHGITLLIMCMVESARRQQQGYCNFSDTMVFAFNEGPKWCKYIAKAAGFLVDGVLSLSHYGVCVVYLVFVAVNLKQLVDHYAKDMDLRIYIAIVGVCLIPLFLIRHLKYLVPFNMNLPPISERKMFNEPSKYPLFFGIVLFSVSSVGVMLAIESKMAHPEQYIGWFGVLNLSAVVVVISYLFFSIFGYWKYGQHVFGSITLNLPTDEVVSQLSKAFISLALFLSYPLSGYVTIDIVVNHYLNRGDRLKNPHFVEYIVRVFFVILSTINAVAFPNLGPLLAFVGALTISLLNLVFPACIELCLNYHAPYTYGKLRWKLVKNILLIVIGLVILVYCCTLSVQDMIKEYGGCSDKESCSKKMPVGVLTEN